MIDPRFERAWGVGCLEKESVRLERKSRNYKGGGAHYMEERLRIDLFNELGGTWWLIWAFLQEKLFCVNV